MNIEQLNNQCTGCTACKTVCPEGCITMEQNAEGFYMPRIDHMVCISCGECDSVCHYLHPSEETKTCRQAFYGWHQDPDKRSASSSGGAFIALAEWILNQGGVVFGAVFDAETKTVKHAGTDEVPLSRILKSKYVESDLGDTFFILSEQLNKGRHVLFCGTPCQVSGLNRTISDPDNLLLTCDFVCHGVPSPRFFKEHLQAIEAKKHDQVQDVVFRDKKDGWSGSNYHLRVKLSKKEYHVFHPFDSYFDGFLTQDVFLRLPCYDCQFYHTHVSDLTLADFWGYAAYDSSINDEKGISLILANTAQGEAALSGIKDAINLHPLDVSYAEYIYHRKDYSAAFVRRKNFYELADAIGFEKAAQQTYMQGKNAYSHVIFQIKRKIKKVLKRLK